MQYFASYSTKFKNADTGIHFANNLEVIASEIQTNSIKQRFTLWLSRGAFMRSRYNVKKSILLKVTFSKFRGDKPRGSSRGRYYFLSGPISITIATIFP